jgi:four helix bundle protein
MRHYKKYRVWQLAHELVLGTYAVAATLPPSEQFGLASQMKRAAVSVSSNIAEGSGRGSDADFCRFLRMASGSANELESQFLILRDLELGNDDQVRQLLGQLNTLRRGLIQLIKATS